MSSPWTASTAAAIKRYRIDLVSDTVTKPDVGMRQAMADAEVGDDVYGEDPMVNALQERVAALLGKEAGLFMPSGTQSNLAALLSHCERGDEFIVGSSYHSYVYEGGGAAALGGVVPCPVPADENGNLRPDDVRAAIKPDRTWFARSRLLALENTVGGQVQPQELVERLCALAREQGLLLHLDGARIWHAAAASGLAPLQLARPFDSVSVCLSKGLGAPAGSVLCGSRDFIGRAARLRKTLGGGMRQAGVLAAAGHYALSFNLPRLGIDHENARQLARGLSGVPGLKAHEGHTNMVFLEVEESRRGPLIEFLAARGIRIGPADSRIRLVTHLDVSRDNIREVVDAIKAFFR
ncbi:low-specificity L-threonine aldolase [Paucibacter sp. B51]|uniref:low-specificity L-threonine aldolase n=1 Tax=Paucibacter sp. B51 TaxID=2993315 RepID=UPI0022EBB488|nr:low-specificity L-threonine aldolase [Paucibacter sp. B51]